MEVFREPSPGGTDREPAASSSPIDLVLNFWRDFDLEKERSGLDEQGMKIAENQETSQKNRRKLAESTRDFRKASPDEKLNLFNSLLKGYQEEVDNLTKRAKFGENAFLNIYQKLYEAPDPYPSLVSISDLEAKLVEFEAENRKMSHELEEFRTEAAHLRNQQATVRRLEERNRQLELQVFFLNMKSVTILNLKKNKQQKTYEESWTVFHLWYLKLQLHKNAPIHFLCNHQRGKKTIFWIVSGPLQRAQKQMEEKIKELVEIKQRSLAEENQKTLEVLKDREILLQEQLRQARESVSNMQKLHEYGQSQLFEFHARSDEERAAKQSEVNLLMDEVERAQTRLLSLEREKEALRTQLHATSAENVNKTSENAETSISLENSLNAKEKIISELHMELHNLEATLSNEREQHMNEMKALKAIVNDKENAIEEIKKELQARPTVKQIDDLRKKVKILQAVGYNSIEAEDWELATSGEELSKLESLLLDKNKKMEHELTQLKVKLSEKEKALYAAEAKAVELTITLNEQQNLITKLEDDILKGYNSVERRTNRFDDWELPEMGVHDILENSGSRSALPDQDQNSMLQVICSQRDRFRKRLQESEEEVRQLKEKIRSLNAELEKTKSDNVKLYGKIRYVQDYTHEKPVSRGSKKRGEDIESGFSSDVELKYKKMYEEDINPFVAFSKKEKEQRYRELGIRDKITLSSGRFLLGNKYARTFIFFYSIGLHLLVFTSLYRMSALSYLGTTPAARDVTVLGTANSLTNLH